MSEIDEQEPTVRTASRESAAGHDPAVWLDLHGDVLFRYALWRVRNAEEAEELVQETLLAGLRGRERFTGRSSQRTWLVGILRRKIVDHFRGAGRSRSDDRLRPSDHAPGELFDKRGHWTVRLRPWPSDPAQAFEAEEFWTVLDKCVGKLPQAMADAFALREMEELSAEDICKILSISTSNLWTQLHRARGLLRQCLELNWFQNPG